MWGAVSTVGVEKCCSFKIIQTPREAKVLFGITDELLLGR
jgi:hypothetical protein